MKTFLEALFLFTLTFLIAQSCWMGSFGPDCLQDCPENCYDVSCQSDTGACNRCKNGFYGDNCTEECPKPCKSSVCDQRDGTCLTECVNGSSLSACSNPCPANCKDGKCYSKTGWCVSCVEGYVGYVCDLPKCHVSFYGLQCSKKCSENCTEPSCDRITGVCSSCKPEVYDMCEEAEISDFCSCCPKTCLDRGCDAVGECVKGCITGYEGPYCVLIQAKKTNPPDTSLCDRGYYGEKCATPCPRQCKHDVCHDKVGTCLKGCKKGYKGARCHERSMTTSNTNFSDTFFLTMCDEGFYGENCSTRCPVHCKNNSCDPVLGFCLAGCEGNYTGAMCEDGEAKFMTYMGKGNKTASTVHEQEDAGYGKLIIPLSIVGILLILVVSLVWSYRTGVPPESQAQTTAE